MDCPTREQIREAAKSSVEAKAALEKLFPAVFEDWWRNITGEVRAGSN